MPPIEQVENIIHEDARRLNIPTSELQSLVPAEQQAPVRVAYEKRNPDLDPQLVWRGKFDGENTLTIKAPPLYIQEKVHPKVLIEDLLKFRHTGKSGNETAQRQLNLFADFNGIANEADKTDFYRHEQNWSNRMILGDSLQVMASLAEREGLRGQVQAIYIDPPYGIKFNSNFQWSTTSRDVRDGKLENFTREPEQVKAFRDTWRDGIHSYLSYLRDRFVAARDLLTDSGSVFVQIGDENVHRVRAIMEEIFGEDNFVSQISFATTTGFSGLYLSSIFNHVLWFAKNIDQLKYHQLYAEKNEGNRGASKYKPVSSLMALKDSPLGPARLATSSDLTSQGAPAQAVTAFTGHKKKWFAPAGLHWKTTIEGLHRLDKASRIIYGDNMIRYLRFMDDFAVFPITNFWNDIGGVQSRTDPKIYVVQTATEVIQRCLLMATDPGDLVLDPTCGSGTTAYVAEQWGRRWITIDTSRVALALARARLMGARYPYYLMADSVAGAAREAELAGQPPAPGPFGDNINLGFVYERVPHITLKSIAGNTQIDEIWDKWQQKLEPLRQKLNSLLKQNWEEWEIPREAENPWPAEAAKLHATLGKAYKVKMPENKTRPLLAQLNAILGSHYKKLEHLPQNPATPWKPEAAAAHAEWTQARMARQKEIDAAITTGAEFEFLYDKPYEDKKKVRVAGPFTVESISPHRMLQVGPDDELLDPAGQPAEQDSSDFAAMILENLRTAGVQQAHKEDKISFSSITPWPGALICAEGRIQEGENEKRAAIFIGPEFGTVAKVDLTRAAIEAGDAGFDLLIACGFNFEAQTTELCRLGRLPILKARMNADLHMSEALKNTGKGNLFVIFGEPDIEIIPEGQGERIMVKINGVDVYYPNTGEIRSDNAADIACWFVDTDYNGQSFFVRQAYFLGQNDPYKALKTTLRAEIDPQAWESLHSDVSRPFPKPKNGHIAVKVINHLGDEVMKVFKV